MVFVFSVGVMMGITQVVAIAYKKIGGGLAIEIFGFYNFVTFWYCLVLIKVSSFSFFSNRLDNIPSNRGKLLRRKH